jgi:hypothetical protein
LRERDVHDDRRRDAMAAAPLLDRADAEFRQAIGLAALAAAVMVAIIGIAFTGNVINQASTEISAIDFVGLTSGSVDELSARRRAAHCGASHDRRLGHPPERSRRLQQRGAPHFYGLSIIIIGLILTLLWSGYLASCACALLAPYLAA